MSVPLRRQRRWENKIKMDASSEVITVVIVKIVTFWIIIRCTLVVGYRNAPTLNMTTACSTEKLVSTHKSTWYQHHIPEDKLSSKVDGVTTAEDGMQTGPRTLYSERGMEQ
jgi:hypothetical protein